MLAAMEYKALRYRKLLDHCETQYASLEKLSEVWIIFPWWIDAFFTWCRQKALDPQVDLLLGALQTEHPN